MKRLNRMTGMLAAAALAGSMVMTVADAGGMSMGNSSRNNQSGYGPGGGYGPGYGPGYQQGDDSGSGFGMGSRSDRGWTGRRTRRGTDAAATAVPASAWAVAVTVVMDRAGDAASVPDDGSDSGSGFGMGSRSDRGFGPE